MSILDIAKSIVTGFGNWLVYIGDSLILDGTVTIHGKTVLACIGALLCAYIVLAIADHTYLRGGNNL